MKIETEIVRRGFDGKQCHVHARGIFGCCSADGGDNAIFVSRITF